MTSGGNRFNDFPEIVPSREITTKIEKTSRLLVHGRAWAYFSNGPSAAASVTPSLVGTAGHVHALRPASSSRKFSLSDYDCRYRYH